MLNVLRRSLLATVISLSATQFSIAAAPELITKNVDVMAMKEAKTSLPLFKSAYEKVKTDLDMAMLNPIDVPVPKDPGGGYTHEQHKYNYKLINDAGIIYQLSGEKKYADFSKKILLIGWSPIFEIKLNLFFLQFLHFIFFYVCSSNLNKFQFV